MKGFPIAACGSLFGSAVTFVALRYLFKNRLRKFSESNEKWQALETVIVSSLSFCYGRGLRYNVFSRN